MSNFLDALSTLIALLAFTPICFATPSGTTLKSGAERARRILRNAHPVLNLPTYDYKRVLPIGVCIHESQQPDNHCIIFS